MRSDLYSYDLPVERIAQRPVYPYDQAKLLIVERETEALSARTFAEIDQCFDPHDLLVFNDSRVIPARLIGTLSGGQSAEVLLVRPHDPAHSDQSQWRCMGRPLRKFVNGSILSFEGELKARILQRVGEYEVDLQFFSESDSSLDHRSLEQGAIGKLIEEVGRMPIPPYIREGLSDAQDAQDYQSIFARRDGSIAAPTASLHFTPPLIERLLARGCLIGTVTLHVGPASFLALSEREGAVVAPGQEQFVVSAELCELIHKTKLHGAKVVAVGTTVVRALESAYASGEGKANESSTALFITPGYQFKVVDQIVTNFHQPGTTHLALVEALIGRNLLDGAYQYALANEFRFLSYGDGMLVR